jgi:hypothetical protein
VRGRIPAGAIPRSSILVSLVLTLLLNLFLRR